jgi:hypothetical protein
VASIPDLSGKWGHNYELHPCGETR